MTRPRSRLRGAAVALGRGVAAILALALVLCLAASVYLSTASGKARLLGAVLAQLNQALPGKISVQQLHVLRPTLVVLEGIRITAPAGNEVIAVARLRVRLQPWSLLGEQIVVPELALEVENADVRAPMEPGTGLVSAFVTPDAAPDGAKSSFALSDLPKLQVTVLHLQARRIGLPEAPVGGPLELRQVALESKVTLGPRLRVELARLDSQVWRRGADLGHLSTRGHADTEQPSRLDWENSLCGMELALHLDGQFPETKDWLDAGFDARLELRELSTARLATLLELPELAATPVGPVGADLRLRGTLRHIELSGTLLSLGGNVAVSATALELADLDQAHLDLVLDAERLRLRPVLESLPDWQLTTKSAVSLSWPNASPGLHLAARSESALDGTPLPLITLQADLADGSVHATALRLEQGLTSLTASGGWSAEGRAHLRLAGHLDLKDGRNLAGALGSTLPNATGQVAIELELDRDSTGRLDARGSLGSRQLQLESAQLEQLNTRFSLAGTLPFPELHLDATWAAVRHDSLALTPGHLKINGKPSRYAFDLTSGALPLGSVAASGWFEPGAKRSRLALAASGSFRDSPWRLDVEPLEILPGGTLRVPAVVLVFAAQHAKLSGTYSPTSAELGLDFADVDLAQVLAPFGVAPGLRGTSSGHLTARGTLERPSLQLELRGKRIGQVNAPTLDTQLSATLDVAAGAFELDSRVCESPESAQGRARLQFRLHAGSLFDKHAAWPGSWRDGEHSATLALQRVEHQIVGELLGEPLPVEFDLQGALSVVARHGVPELHWKGSGKLEPKLSAFGGAEALSEQITHELDYHDGQIETILRVQDGEGEWLTLQARAEPLPGHTRPPRLSELLERAQLPVTKVLEDAVWSLELAAKPRTLARWPLPASVLYLSDARLAAALSAHGHPLGEPQGKLTFDLSGAPTQGDETICVTRDWRIGGQLDFEDGDFRVDVSGYHGQEQLLQLNTDGRFALLPRLRGETPSPPRLDVVAKIERLPLAGLPLVCQRARGVLSSTLRVQDPFGSSPRATLDLGVLGFSLGSEQVLDLKAQIAVDPQQLVAHGSLTGQGSASSIELRLPVPAAGFSSAPAQDAAVEGKLSLQALPLATVVPKQGPLSHVSGTASGSVQLQGTVGAPRLSGELKIQQTGFTATALAQPLSDIDGEISFADDVILLKQLSAKDGDGTLGIDGRVKIESANEFDGTFNLAANKFPLRQAGQVMATTSANAQIQALWSPAVRDLRIQLRDFDTWLEGVQATSGLGLDAHPDIVIDDPATRSATPAEGEENDSPPGSKATKLIVRIDAGQQFWVRRADFAIKLSANLEIVVDEKSAAPESRVSVTGQLEFDRGYLELLGRVFDIERGGTLRFTGGGDATIDLSATYLDRRSEKTVKVQLSGSAMSPQLEFFLEGTRINAGEAFTAIYGTETTSSDQIEDTEAQAKAFVSALTAGMIATGLRRKLGALAPIVMVTPGDSQSSGQLRAGFEADALIPEFMRGVVTGVYVEGILSSDNTAANGSSQRDVQRGVAVDVHFPHNLVTSGRYGPDTTWSLDFGWQP